MIIVPVKPMRKYSIWTSSPVTSVVNLFFLKLSDKPLRGHAPRQDDIDPKFVVAEKQGIEVKSALTLNDVQGLMPDSIQLQTHLLNLTQVTNLFDDQDKTSVILLNITIGSVGCVQS